jgi:RNA polymerase sigma-70 factor (ECF subfamily)
MTANDSFVALMQRFRSDEDAAVRDVFRRFTRQLLALTRRQFEQRLAHRIDPEDVVQSAFKSFFVRYREGQFQIGDWNRLWGLLALITRRKCADRVAYLRARRRDVRRELPTQEDPEQFLRLAPGREPLPAEAAALADTVEHLLRAVEADELPVLELSLQGYTAAEISLRLGRSLRTVHRLRERIRSRILRLQEAE